MISPKAPLSVHVDLDGADVIFRAHGRRYGGRGDPIYRSGMERLLSLFAAFDIRATLFVIAEDLNDPEKRAVLEHARAAGHDFASHTVTHPNLRAIGASQKRQELETSRKSIEDALGVAVKGFRAPGYSMDADGMRMLLECGYSYDSSCFHTPAFATRLDVPLAELERPRRLSPYEGLIELPLPDHRPMPIPVGPSYALLAGFPLFAWGMKRASARALPTVLLFHLIDFAAPLESANLDGLRMRIFTLSNRTAEYKRTAGERMLTLARAHFDIVPTETLLQLADITPTT